jgi:mannose-6-phosphate isomerase-like protein (cupin superfamily)
MSYPQPADGAYPPPRYTGEGGEASARFRGVGQPPETVGATTSTHHLATGAATGGQFGLYRWDMGPERSGPDPHFHRSITESFFVLEGSVELHDGTGWREASSGDFLFVPEGGVHGFRNDSGEPASMLILFTPGAPREDYFETLADTVRREAMDDEQRAAFFLRHDTFWV